ncbi:MAG: M20 family metallopeptidase [Deinococcota bacterium]
MSELTHADCLAHAQQAAAAVDADRVIALTRDLVRIKSVYEPEQNGNETEVVKFLQGYLQEIGLTPVLEHPTPSRPNLICDWQGSSFKLDQHATLMFEGHTDVVTEGDASTWSYPPFAAELVDGIIYGRGSCDMKAGVAAAIEATHAVMQTSPDLAGRIRLGIVCDEEGMMIGIKHFIAQGWADEVDAAIICEPEQQELCLFQKGAMRVTVTVQGVMSHGAMPYAGCNPIVPLAAFIGRVHEVQQAEQARLGEHPELGLPWFTPTIFNAPARGEAQNNVMPEAAVAALDIRTVPGQDHDEILATLQSIAQEIASSDPRLQIEVDCFESRPWTQTPEDAHIVRALEAVYPHVMNEAPKYGGVPGATDGTFLHATAGVPIVTIGPGEREVPHQRDEHVSATEVVRSTRLYAAAAVYFLLSQAKG